MLRAGPFSDERVIALINLRFVPVYFDLSNEGAAADPTAREFVVAARPDLGGKAVPLPPVLLMDAVGKVLVEIPNNSDPNTFLAALVALLHAHPEIDRPSPAELAARTPIERASIRMALQDLAGARNLLEEALIGGPPGDRSAEGSLDDEQRSLAHYLLGRLARLARDWGEMERQFALVGSALLQSDMRMERGYRLWLERHYDELRAQLVDFPRDHPRCAEARYYEGLAHFHIGDLDKALSTWKQAVETMPEGPWIYRADWAYSNLMSPSKELITSADERVSILGRLGYLGPRNPDLEGPPALKPN